MGKCRVARELGRRQEGARSPPLPSQAEMPRTDLPRGASAKCQTSVSPYLHPPNRAPLGPDSPPSPPAGRGREVPRKSGRETLPSPGRSKAYQHWETLSRTHPARACRRSPQPLAPGDRRKKACALRLYSHRFPVSGPQPGRVPGQEGALGDPECYRVRVSKRVWGREKG